ncbi:MAG TPA: NAD(P)/FAD-dependent oxidoreductase [Microthrixaceae bacterium]|nr:NAD(P)/FAD-dependent oxidoreductase [Microthrixaceae bacterium]
MRNPAAGTPFTTSDEDIASALEDVSIPTLLLSLVHLTGDPEIIRGDLKPAGLFLNEVQGYMSEEDKAAARELALGHLIAYRDAGCPEPAPISAELVHEMMEWLVVEPVPKSYVPMLLDELELDGPGLAVSDIRSGADAGINSGAGTPVGADESAVGTGGEPAPDRAARAEFPVVVIGAGQSGLLAGIRLKQAGIPFTIVEKNPGVGGTWWENTYPGARVDVGNHFYCYSFEPSHEWTEFFAQQPELQAYFQSVMERRGLEPHIQFETEVLGATWDDDAGTWSVRTRAVDGTENTLDARAVISAVGQLNRPSIPDIPGADSFEGPSFHSARWDHDLDLSGKRVAMIGAGASGFQIAPAIADTVGHLSIFQRTAQWMFPNPDYHAAVGDGVRWALEHLPFYGRWYRFLIFWPGCDKGLEAARVDPDYTGDRQVAVSDVNDFARIMFTEWITEQVGDDPELLSKVLPDYPATGKRTLQDNGSWLRTLKRDDVDLIRTGIDHIESDAIVTVDGERHEADVIVYATGFRYTEALWPMEIIGRDGVDLRQRWGTRPAAYLGITVPEFPNLFLMYGPGTNLAHGGSLIFHSECQMRYITHALEQLIDGGHRTMEPLQERYDDWHARSQAELQKLVWAQPTIKHSFFKNADGEIHGLSPWPLVDYWTWTKEANLADFDVRD